MSQGPLCQNLTQKVQRVPNGQLKFLMRYAIRWFKCKLKPPKNLEKSWNFVSPEVGILPIQTCSLEDLPLIPDIWWLLLKNVQLASRQHTSYWNDLADLEGLMVSQ